jgi:hypothetical protein
VQVSKITNSLSNIYAQDASFLSKGTITYYK